MFNFVGFCRAAQIRNTFSCFPISFTYQVEFFLPDFLNILQLKINDILNPDLVSVATAHMVYFCACARSEINKNARVGG